jgi:hypothetical protein
MCEKMAPGLEFRLELGCWWSFSKVDPKRIFADFSLNGINFRTPSQAIFTRSELDSGRSEYSALIFESGQNVADA